MTNQERRTTRGTYKPLGQDPKDIEVAGGSSLRQDGHVKSHRQASHVQSFIAVIATVIAGTAGFIFGVLFAESHPRHGHLRDVAPRISLPAIQRIFTFPSPFSQKPPGPGNASEPIWDALVPNGLGYFRDTSISPGISIPTVFHQLHCLYIIRRAYYSRASTIEEFDFGKNRTVHVAHCFDYLQQGLTCSADTTVESAAGNENGFLGSGFGRQCNDFDALKDFVEERRVFNATGFLAAGLDHGKAHVG
ncbi:hypothetical protein GGS20DRAFT_567584 [Poronia punctata]|nr:hypothetical protein GGS20DRAFT_567584 [Poronia punctata]